MGNEVKFQYLPLMKWKFDENFQVGYGYIRLLIVIMGSVTEPIQSTNVVAESLAFTD